jgi:hypothetical protein
MELREMIIALAGFSIGLGIGLGIYAVSQLRKNRNERWLAKSGERYQKIIAKIDKETAQMQKDIDGLTELKEYYRAS